MDREAMHPSHIAAWAAILVVIVSGLVARFLFMWEPRSKRSQTIYYILFGVLVLILILMKYGYVRM